MEGSKRTCEGSNGVDVDGSEAWAACIHCCRWACVALAKLNCEGGGPLNETSKAAAPDNGGEGWPGAE